MQKLFRTEIICQKVRKLNFQWPRSGHTWSSREPLFSVSFRFRFRTGIIDQGVKSGRSTSIGPLSNKLNRRNLSQDEESLFTINNYRHNIHISDRYVRSEVIVKASHTSSNPELFEFGLQLEDFEFISWLSLRMGENGEIITATVHKEKEAKDIFDNNVGQPKEPTDGAISLHHQNNNSFLTKVMVPAGENLYLWIHYDQLLTRTNNQFAYQTHINPTDEIDQFEITGSIFSPNITPNPKLYRPKIIAPS